MGGEPVLEPVENVADHRPGRGGHHADPRRREWQRPLARLVEQPLRRELAPTLVEQRHQRALSGKLEPVDDDLVARARRIGGEPPGCDHLYAVLGLEPKRARLPAPDHCIDAGVLVLEREIAMAGSDPLEAGNLAAHPDMIERAFDRALQRRRKLGDRNGARVVARPLAC